MNPAGASAKAVGAAQRAHAARNAARCEHQLMAAITRFACTPESGASGDAALTCQLQRWPTPCMAADLEQLHCSAPRFRDRSARHVTPPGPTAVRGSRGAGRRNYDVSVDFARRRPRASATSPAPNNAIALGSGTTATSPVTTTLSRKTSAYCFGPRPGMVLVAKTSAVGWVTVKPVKE